MKTIKWIVIALILVIVIYFSFGIWRRAEIREAGEVLLANFTAGNIEQIYNKDIMFNYNSFELFNQVVELYGIKGAEFIEWTDYSFENIHKQISAKLDLLEGDEETFTFFFVRVDGELEFIDLLKTSIASNDEK